MTFDKFLNDDNSKTFFTEDKAYSIKPLSKHLKWDIYYGSKSPKPNDTNLNYPTNILAVLRLDANHILCQPKVNKFPKIRGVTT